jgi:signal transduction histidine kinase
VIVFCDANTLRQALGEVMLNAMAFSTPQDVIEVAQWSADGWTSISIRDRGPGIPEEAQARVFEPFFQVNREWQEQQGIGIGLTLVKEIVEMHGGKVDLQSQRGVGTDVRVSLPIHSDNNRQ